MKKATTLALAAIATAGLTTLATPAYAGDDRAEACHATGSGYVSIAASTNAFIKAGHGSHEGDIYDAFSYKTKNGDVVNDPGKNWNVIVANGFTGKEIFLNGCTIPDQKVSPLTPELVQDATCIDRNGRVEVPAQPDGVVAGEPVWADGAWVVEFTAADGYVFPDGSKSTTWPVTPTAVDADDCLLPEVGFDSATLPLIGGGILVAGGILVGYSAYTRRKDNA